MNHISLIDAIGLLFNGIAFIFVWKSKKNFLSGDSRFLLSLVILLTGYFNFGNLLEWGNISSGLDRLEDYLRFLEPIIWGFFMYSYIAFNRAQKQELLQEKLNQSQKMDAIGKLAGGIAHDFNNMLGGILGGAELLRSAIPENKECQEYLDIIENSAEQASDLASKLLTFSRKQKMEMKPLRIHKCLDETIKILENTIDKKIRIEHRFHTIRDLVEGDRSQLQSLFLNMGINASQAMPEGGILRFTSRQKSLRKEDCDDSPFDMEPGDYIVIEVKDTGTGIPPEILQNIYDPFFTTKKQGEGTGLGLTACYGTVKQMKGSIAVQSNLSPGTTFTLMFPLQEGHEDFLVKERGLIQGIGKILVIDDEVVIRSTVKAILNRCGYKVICAESGKEGLEIYKKDKENINLIILDMIMPEMDGKQCFFELKTINPLVKIVLCSGYTKDEDLQDLKEKGLNAFISKPFKGNELSRIIKEQMLN